MATHKVPEVPSVTKNENMFRRVDLLRFGAVFRCDVKFCKSDVPGNFETTLKITPQKQQPNSEREF